MTNLINGDDGVNAQEHVYKDWPEAGVDDEGKVQLAEQVSSNSNVCTSLLCCLTVHRNCVSWTFDVFFLNYFDSIHFSSKLLFVCSIHA